MGSCCSVIVFHSSPPGLGEVTVNVTPASPQADAPLTSSTPNSLTRPPSQPRSRISISTTKHDSSHNPASRHRFASAPQPNPINRILSKQSLFQLRAGTRYRSSAIPRPDTSGHSGSRLSRPVHPKAGTRSLVPTTRQILLDHTKFRVLVVGKRASGKSSLIDAVFKVDTRAAPKTLSGTPDIDLECCPEDNCYLGVHESSGFEHGDLQSTQAIRDFISYRTDPNRLPTERLHAVRICVPACDVINGSIGEGVEAILEMRRRVPVIVVLTKFDMVVSQVLHDSGGRSFQHDERARTIAYLQCEQACRSLFRTEPRDVPAEIVSVKPQFRHLLDALIVTTDRFMMGRIIFPPGRSSAQGAKPRIAHAPLVWSVASRVSSDITIQASIEVGRSRYWRGLWSSLDFADQPLTECVNVIHTDIVEIWNFNDKTRYLSSGAFKEHMSYVVKDLADSNVPLSPVRSRSRKEFAEWVYDIYRGSQENVRCVMGYIVDLTVILDQILRSTDRTVSANDVQLAVDRHVNLGRRDRIHWEIRAFVTETFAIRFTVPQRDLVLDKIIDLIRQNCVPLSTSTYYSANEN